MPAAFDFKQDAYSAGLERLRAAQRREPFPSLAQRLEWLGAVEALITDYRDALTEAISLDFGHRSAVETWLGEFWLTLNQLKYVRNNLAEWMRPQPSEVNWSMYPGRAALHFQPRGVVGILSPWNYPVMLVLAPLLGALAAGNRVVIKLSELTPRTSLLLADALNAHFGPDVVLPVLGAADAGQHVAGSALDLLLFTGSERVGREVLLAAAARMTPVVLELGGKCPAILAPGYSPAAFARAVAQGKCFSAGQSCVAPDYVLVPKGTESEVADALSKEVTRRYPTLANNHDYSSVAGKGRFERLVQLRDEAVTLGATQCVVNPASEELEALQKFPFTLLLNPPAHCRAMKEEIFGPLLPIIAYDGAERAGVAAVDEALAFVAARPTPLALYYFDSERERIEHVLRTSLSGGVTVNDTLVHFLNDSLPRGGVGPSGMGTYQGRHGFITFSHQKPVFEQAVLPSSALLAPPFGALKRKLLHWLSAGLLG